MSDQGAKHSILITGASRGIGRALALAYAAPGTRLCLFGRDQPALEATAEGAKTKGAEIEISRVDVRDANAMEQAIGALDEAAPLDLVIVNAGVTSGRAPDGTPECPDAARVVLETNLIGAFNTVAPVISRMRARGAGQIAVMGSLAARSAHPSSPAYSAAKAGVEAYGLALRHSLARDGIRVSVISPGYVDTAMSRQLETRKLGMMTSEKAASIIQRGLAANRAMISFPPLLAFGAKFLPFFPDRLRRKVMKLLSFSVHPPK